MESAYPGLFLALILVLLLLAAGFFVLVIMRVFRFIERQLPYLVRAGLTLPPVKRVFASYPDAVAFFARFSSIGGLVLRLSLGLLVSILLGLIFAEIADELQDEWLILVDETVLTVISRLRTPWLTDLFLLITFLGSGYFVAACSLLVALVLLIVRRPILLIGFSAIISGGGLFNHILKAVFTRPRPFYEPIAEAAGWSFPSGHAMTSIVFYGALVYLLFLLVKRRSIRIAAMGVALFLVLLIGFSRMYLGVHYLTDVVAGYTAGLIWLVASISALDAVRKRRR